MGAMLIVSCFVGPAPNSTWHFWQLQTQKILLCTPSLLWLSEVSCAASCQQLGVKKSKPTGRRGFMDGLRAEYYSSVPSKKETISLDSSGLIYQVACSCGMEHFCDEECERRSAEMSFVRRRNVSPEERAELSRLLVDADFFSFVPSYPEMRGNSRDIYILKISATLGAQSNQACVTLGGPIRLIAAGTDRAACRYPSTAIEVHPALLQFVERLQRMGNEREGRSCPDDSESAEPDLDIDTTPTGGSSDRNCCRVG